MNRKPQSPLVSLVIPSFNRADLIGETLMSVIAERQDDLEIIVVDDGSTDATESVVRPLPVTYHRFSRNRGLSHARNFGIEQARGEFITFLDSDDLLYPGGIAWRVRWLQEHPREMVVGGRAAGGIEPDGRRVEFMPYPMPKLLSLSFFRQGNIYCCAPWLYCFRKKIFDQLGMFDPGLSHANDSDLIFRILSSQTIPIVDRPVMWYRRHDGNESALRKGGKFVYPPRVVAETFLVNRSYGIA